MKLNCGFDSKWLAKGRRFGYPDERLGEAGIHTPLAINHKPVIDL